jgi:hypothetical protein
MLSSAHFCLHFCPKPTKSDWHFRNDIAARIDVLISVSNKITVFELEKTAYAPDVIEKR